jgi:hypothetical protein
MGTDAVSQLLMDTYRDDPNRLAIYAQAFAGTQYEHLVHAASLGDAQI